MSLATFIISEWPTGENQYFQCKIRKHLKRDSTGKVITSVSEKNVDIAVEAA